MDTKQDQLDKVKRLSTQEARRKRIADWLEKREFSPIDR